MNGTSHQYKLFRMLGKIDQCTQMVKLCKPRITKPPAKTVENLYDSDEDSTFSNWLRSEDGITYMKIFVLINTVFVFTLMTWPNIKQMLNTLYYTYMAGSKK